MDFDIVDLMPLFLGARNNRMNWRELFAIESSCLVPLVVVKTCRP